MLRNSLHISKAKFCVKFNSSVVFWITLLLTNQINICLPSTLHYLWWRVEEAVYGQASCQPLDILYNKVAMFGLSEFLIIAHKENSHPATTTTAAFQNARVRHTKAPNIFSRISQSMANFPFTEHSRFTTFGGEACSHTPASALRRKIMKGGVSD